MGPPESAAALLCLVRGGGSVCATLPERDARQPTPCTAQHRPLATPTKRKRRMAIFRMPAASVSVSRFTTASRICQQARQRGGPARQRSQTCHFAFGKKSQSYPTHGGARARWLALARGLYRPPRPWYWRMPRPMPIMPFMPPPPMAADMGAPRPMPRPPPIPGTGPPPSPCNHNRTSSKHKHGDTSHGQLQRPLEPRQGDHPCFLQRVRQRRS